MFVLELYFLFSLFIYLKLLLLKILTMINITLFIYLIYFTLYTMSINVERLCLFNCYCAFQFIVQHHRILFYKYGAI